ncbi:MAG TPA: glycosyltransferase, partial [Atribacterota bacterium]|nr:glycosyltransferase [Atribacterota bacterium]
MKSKIKDEIIDKNEINILMATYNGEKYVSEQIESIINQSFTNWILLIRDDESTDNTMKILDKYEKQESRIAVIRDDLGNLGQCLNFNEIMKNVKTDSYVMFSDQDDVWLPTKIEESVKEIKRLENIRGTETPILV